MARAPVLFVEKAVFSYLIDFAPLWNIIGLICVPLFLYSLFASTEVSVYLVIDITLFWLL